MIFKSGMGSDKPGGESSYDDEPASAPRASTPAAAAPKPGPAVWTSLDKVQISGHFQLNEGGELQIGGNVKGNIKCRALTVNHGGSMKGDVTADIVLISGHYSGKIDVGRLTLAGSAKVKSEDVLVREAIVIEEGADFEGNLRRMTGEEPKSKTKAADGKSASSKKSGDETLVAADTVPKEAVIE